MKLLLTGDIHLGRSSTRISVNGDTTDLRAVSAWRRIVETAFREKVDAVCLSGDIVDQDNRFLESIGPLESEISRLTASGIHVLAVAGNHDFQVLPRVAEHVNSEYFHFLGQGGKWERVTVSDQSGNAVHVDGWSFPQRYVNESPLDSYNLPADRTIPTIGLVHGDLHDAKSPYGFLNINKLRSLDVSGWLLGHIHKPELDCSAGASWVLYPGSPQALSPAEQGVHGAWLTETEGNGLKVPVQAAISSVRYEELDIDMTGISSREAAESRFFECIRQAAQELHDTGHGHCAVLSLRIRLTGESALAHEMEAIATRVREDLTVQHAGLTVQVEKIRNATTAAINLEEHAGTHTAPGALVDILRELDEEKPSGRAHDLLAQVMEDIRRVDRTRDFSTHLDPRAVDETMARDFIRAEARRLLSHLVAQIRNQ